jgi:uncharacterized glyoxalase superfamily protein PhnB
MISEKALGAKVLNISRYGDAPGNKLPDEQKGLVMHAMLSIGGAR